MNTYQLNGARNRRRPPDDEAHAKRVRELRAVVEAVLVPYSKRIVAPSEVEMCRRAVRVAVLATIPPEEMIDLRTLDLIILDFLRQYLVVSAKLSRLERPK